MLYYFEPNGLPTSASNLYNHVPVMNLFENEQGWLYILQKQKLNPS